MNARYCSNDSLPQTIGGSSGATTANGQASRLIESAQTDRFSCRIAIVFLIGSLATAFAGFGVIFLKQFSELLTATLQAVFERTYEQIARTTHHDSAFCVYHLRERIPAIPSTADPRQIHLAVVRR